MINLLGINKIEILTVAKVASSSFYYSLRGIYSSHHGHSTKTLQEVVEFGSNTLIIIGVRNPLDRNLSYLFQTCQDDFKNDVKTSKNNYEGEYCFICNNILDMPINKIIDEFYKMNYHFTFNDWFEDAFNILKLDNLEFDKNKGFSLYELKNNNHLLLYTMEQLPKNNKELAKFFNITTLIHSNNADNRNYKHLYSEVKSKIKFDDKYKGRLLDTKYMDFFYTKSSIEQFRQKY